jgi:hypothetical protein
LGQPSHQGRTGRPIRARRGQKHRPGTDPQRTHASAAERRQAQPPARTGMRRATSCRLRLRTLCLVTITTGAGSAPVRLVAQPGRVPALGQGCRGIGRRLDVVGLGPGHALFGAETAAMGPAFFRRLAAAGMILTGKGVAMIFASGRRHGHSQGGRQVRNQGQASAKSAGQGSPATGLSGPQHGR